MPGRAAVEPSPLRALLWPFRFTVLALVAVLAPLYALAPMGGVAGVFLLYFLASITCRYGDVLLGRALQGEASPAPLSLEHLQPFRWRASFALLVLLGAWLLASLGATAGRGVALALLALLPLWLALLHVGPGVAAACNPWRWLRWALALGPWYPLVLGTGAAGGGLLVLAGFAGLPTLAGIAGALLLFFGLLSFMGAACHARRFELGYEPMHSSERDAARAADERARERARFIDALYVPVRNAKVADLRALLAKHLASLDPRWLDEEAEGLLQAATAWGVASAVRQVGEQLLAQQLRCGHVHGALATAQRLVHADPAWRPADAGEQDGLARLADEEGRGALARQLRGAG